MQTDAGDKYTYYGRIEFSIVMNIKSLIATVIETIIKVIIIALAVSYIIKGVSAAYDFGYRVFADEPVSLSNGRTITVGIAESAKVKDIGVMLQEKGLIEDSKLFVVQELLSEYHGMIKPGIYDLSTDMKTADMLRIMSAESEENEDESPKPSSPAEEGVSLDEAGSAEEGLGEEGLQEDGEPSEEPEE